jgi:hypothetical protein
VNEIELAESVIAWLESDGWDIYQEVQVYGYGGVADIVAVHDGWLIWIVECKKSLTLRVMNQASKWPSHYRSVALLAPKRKNYERSSRDSAYRVAKQYYKIGVMELSKGGELDETEKAPLMRHHHKTSKTILNALAPEHKTYAKAGSRGGSHWTPYKSTIRAVEHHVIDNPGCTLKELIEEIGKRHYASTQSARSTLRVNLESLHEDWCTVDKSTRPYRYYHK